MRLIITVILVPVLFLSPGCITSKKSIVEANMKYKEGFVQSDKVKLQYLDWGGEGEVLVLIAGLGDTPFIFTPLAEGLSTSFRVIAYSRRYHGRSEAKENAYDNEILVEDLKLLLDSLRIDKAHLLGWSLGGNEITTFASLYPDRVGRLIYLEAGYDMSDGGFERLLSNIPTAYLPGPAVMRSIDSYRQWYHQFWFGDVEWNDALEANLQATVKTPTDGSIQTIPSDDVFKAILHEAMNYRRSYDKVAAPCLVIYTRSYFHPIDNNPATIKLYSDLESDIISPWREANKKRIITELSKAIIVEAPCGTHTSFLFLSIDFLVNTIRSFLNSDQ